MTKEKNPYNPLVDVFFILAGISFIGLTLVLVFQG